VQHFIESPAHVLMVVRGTREFWDAAVPASFTAGGFAGAAVVWTGTRKKKTA